MEYPLHYDCMTNIPSHIPLEGILSIAYMFDIDCMINLPSHMSSDATVLPLSIGNNANASLEVTNSFQATVRLVSISITNVYDLAGNVVPLISNTTDGSTVTLGERYRRPIYRP
jgi:hypothetical protein